MDDSIPRVSLLGGFSVATEGGVVEERAWRLRKAKALVKLLALAPERRLHRERLADLLWPDRDAEAAANNLHQALHAARRAIGPDVLRLSDGVVTLDAEVDVDAFEAAAARARDTGVAADYESALDLHPGELLPEDRYESWADARRAALLELHGALCIELADLYGEDAQAVAALQRALVVDPLAEPAHRALMRVYAATGRRQQALAQYQLLRQQLDAELAAEPDRETRDLYRELLVPEPATETRGNLPQPLTSFVGRERERGEIVRLLDRVRMLTLIGPGGCGKTRLAIETLAGIEPPPDGIWFVELAGLTDGALVAQATALAVGAPLPAHRSAQEALAAHLAARQAIVVLDNCEHVIDACAPLAEDLLRAGPGVRVVATSREPLHCEGEVAWRVPSLAEASRLFVERAAADPDFAPTEQDNATIEEICRRLDGMPLAIELAAARVAALSVEQIAARLGDSLDVLAAGSRTARTRQQTLRATIEWSHDLLTGEERVLFRRLAMFAGGFTLEAAEDVCASGGIARRQIVDLLARLVDKSLVSVTGQRFRLLDTIRQYADERLGAAAEHDMVAVRHLDWCLALAEEHDPLSAGPRRSLRTLETEHDNLRAGLSFALRRDPQAALRLATSLWRFWLDRGYFAEGDRWLEATLVAAPERTALRVEALLASAGLSLRSGESAHYLLRVQEAVADYRELGDEHATAAALYQHAMLEQSVSHTARADALFADAIALAHRMGDPRLLAAATHASAMTPWYRSDRERAQTVICEALALLEDLPDDETPFFEGVTFGLCLLQDGPEGRPRLHLEETIFPFHRFTRAQAIGYALNNLAWTARATGDLARATAALDEALQRFRAVEDRAGAALTLNHMGSLARMQGDLDTGRAHFSAALDLRRELGEKRAILMSTMSLGLLEMSGGEVVRGRELVGEALSRAESVDDLPAMAGVQTNWGLAEERRGDLESAERLLDAGRALWGVQLLRRFEGWAQIALGDVRERLGDEAGAGRALEAARELLLDSEDVAAERYLATKGSLSGCKDAGS
jgi:predicted ATPase/DNA-binding SARP family transcriptional activator